MAGSIYKTFPLLFLGSTSDDEKSIYSIDSNEKLIDWKDRGNIIIHIPAGAVPFGTQPTITITPVPVKDSMIPDDMYLVSDVFEVTMQSKFLKPITLKLRHCVRLENTAEPDHASHSLTFVKMKVLKFERYEGGAFAVRKETSYLSQYGILKSYSFSSLAICIERVSGLHLFTVVCCMRILRSVKFSDLKRKKHYISVIVTKDCNTIADVCT